MLSAKLLDELNQIIREEFGVKLDITETTSVARDLLQYFEVLSRENYS